MAQHFNFKKITKEDNDTFELSKIGGSPVFPKNFYKKNKLQDDFFFAQVNLKELSSDPLPKEGFLYFFLKCGSYPYKARVFYSKEEPKEVIEGINDDFADFGNSEGYQLVKSSKDTGFALCSDFNPDLDLESQVTLKDGICLLEIDTISLPPNTLTLGQPDGWYMFVMKKEDLKKLDFSKVEFMEFGS